MTVDGKTESKRPVATVVTAQPVAQVVAVGTKSRPRRAHRAHRAPGQRAATTSADAPMWDRDRPVRVRRQPRHNTGNGFYGG